jgi:transcriptional regulator with XRE-family HTH domain
MNDESKITSVTSICIIILRELRVERGFHQAQVADWMGKTPSAWTKIEAGKSPLQFETFIRVCNGMAVMPSAVMGTAERYAAFLNQNGWAILSTELDSAEDRLLSQAQQYWSSAGGRSVGANRWGYLSVLNGPLYESNRTVTTIAPVFRFALDAEFRQSQLNYQPIASNGL